jgi:hypothetical protein
MNLGYWRNLKEYLENGISDFDKENMMPKDPNIHFLKPIIDVFDSVFRDYGFKIYEENLDLVIAKKGDIELLFRLEATKMFYYFSLEIKLLGGLGEQATSDPSYRHLGVTAIAKCINPNYKISLKAAQTETELKEMMEIQKEELLDYCKGILLGDVSIWQRVVYSLNAKKK